MSRKSSAAVALGRRGGIAARGKSGRKAIPTKCPKCGALQPSAVQARAHCMTKSG